MGFFAPFRAKRPPSAALADKRRLGKIRAERRNYLPEKIFSENFFRRSPRRRKETVLIPTYRAAKLLNLLCRIWRNFSGFCLIEAGRGFAKARENTSEAVFYAPRKNFFAVPPKGPILILTERTSFSLGGRAPILGLWPQNLFCPRRKGLF